MQPGNEILPLCCPHCFPKPPPRRRQGCAGKGFPEPRAQASSTVTFSRDERTTTDEGDPFTGRRYMFVYAAHYSVVCVYLIFKMHFFSFNFHRGDASAEASARSRARRAARGGKGRTQNQNFSRSTLPGRETSDGTVRPRLRVFAVCRDEDAM